MKPTRTIRDSRGTTRILDVAPCRAVRWWWDVSLKLWVVEVVDGGHVDSYPDQLVTVVK